MDMQWIIYDGENGLGEFFDVEKNKSKNHKRDDKLVPFRTKSYAYDDFSAVLGHVSRLLTGTTVNKKSSLLDELAQNLRLKMEDCSDSDFEVFLTIVKSIYFEDDKLMPVNIKALNYIGSNVTQQQVAEYIFSLFIENTGLEEKYNQMIVDEDTNVLDDLVFQSLQDNVSGVKEYVHAECLLPYVKECFCADYGALINNSQDYKTYALRMLAYYYYFYISQLAVKLMKFEKADRNKIEPIYMTLNWEVVTKVRPGYEYGWKYVKDKLGHMFSHSVLMEMLSHNVDDIHLDYIGLAEKFSGTETDASVAKEIEYICEQYKEWIPMDYDKCIHSSDKDGKCEVSNVTRRLFELIDYQFINGGRTSHYNGYNKKFIEFAQKNFGKSRGTLGYTIGVNESDIVMFTRVILANNSGRMKLSSLFYEYEKRGLLFDRESKMKITDLLSRMDLLEKRSDSGDAQYVKYIL